MSTHLAKVHVKICGPRRRRSVRYRYEPPEVNCVASVIGVR
jgi:hypothetical protein